MELKFRKSKLIQDHENGHLFNIGDVISRQSCYSDENEYLAVVSGYKYSPIGMNNPECVSYQLIRLNMLGDPVEYDHLRLDEASEYKAKLFRGADEYTLKLISYFFYNEYIRSDYE